MLTRLSVRGFKSFADPTTLHLGPGVNVVVGPNGSGKSNLAEAVVWALGEQRAGRLRAGGMADVLYSGGDRRPGAPYAEVSLVLGGEEADGRGPAEVEASRRLTRAGDADYRLNSDGCRLLDVQEALASRGVGPDALAVIRQGQVEALCTSTPVERRAMVDAAAGVAVAKRRRRRAEQKLGRVADRLDRARDIAGEVRSRARALDRQARAAERAEALDAEIEGARRAVGAARARAAAAAHSLALAEAGRLREVARADAQALEEARAVRSRAGQARAEAAGAAARAQDLAAALRTAADRTAGRAELAAERVAAADAEAAERVRRRRAAADLLESLAGTASAAGAAVERAREAAAAADLAAAAAEGADAAARGEHRRLQDTAAAESAALLAAERESATAVARVEEARAALSAAQNRLRSLAGDVLEADALARAERREEIASERVVRWAERHRRSEIAEADAAAARGVAEVRIREARVAARALAPGDEGRAGGPGGLGDGLAVEEGAEHAVAAALGMLAEAVTAPSIAAAREALETGAGCAVVPAPPRAAGAPVPGGRPVLDLVVSCADEARPHLERLLADAWLVDDLEAVAPRTPGLVVTREGFALRPADGLVFREAGSWARRALHGRAQEAEAVAADTLERAAAGAAEAADALAVVLRRRRAAERSGSRAAEGLATLRAKAGGRAARAHQAAEEAERVEAELAAHIVAAQAAGPRVERARAAATMLSEAVRVARAAAETASGELRTCAGAAADARAALAAARAEEAEAAARLAATQARAQSPGAGYDISAARRASEALAAAARVLAAAADAARGLQSEADAHARDLDAGVAAGERAVEEAERAVEASAGRAHAAEVEAAVAGERSAEAGPPPGPAEVLPEAEQAATALADLERRRESIGAVNPLAGVEREELTARETEMIAQIDDLDSTAAALRGHLAELDAAVAEGFDALFEAFRDRFTEVCALLFPGGEGRLRAVVDDDGEAGIEVEVVPAGKRPRSLTLMSGGERSLVALAFCLALAMARPAPFYLLDEVEAALDDVNLRRFLAVVRRLSERTQFLLITHQQPTVEIADTIFGVTMGAEGVSQVVARRLRRDVEGPARPYVRRALHAIPGGRSG